MTEAARNTKGSAEAQGGLWSARARDWADAQEAQCAALFAAGLAAVGVGAGGTLLDVGCGAGGACVEAARRGAAVSGIDAAPALVEIARSRGRSLAPFRLTDGSYRLENVFRFVVATA